MTKKFDRMGYGGELRKRGPSVDPLEARIIGHELELLDVLIAFSETLAAQTTMNAVLDRIIEAIDRLGSAQRVSIVLRDDPTPARHRDPLAGKYPDDLMAISRTVVEECLAKNQTLYFDDLRSHPRLSATRSVRDLNLRAAVCVPLRDTNGAFGVLYLDSQQMLPYGGREMRLLEAYGVLASLALNHRREVEGAHEQLSRVERERDAALAQPGGAWARDLVGQSRIWTDVLHQIDIAKDLEHAVLIQGESGTGKELVARAIFRGSARRRSGPFVALNCAGLDAPLLEATLFGTVKGAFTGAVDRPGYVEAAEGGVLFLDEIGDMSPEVQQHFLRFLDNRQFRRLGSIELREANVRIVAATNRDLQQLTKANAFRFDLYSRINQFRIEVPPLRSRIDDVPLLVHHFLDRLGRSSVHLSPECIDLMRRYDWPGNVRQLKNAIEIAALSAGDGGVITPAVIQQRAGMRDDDILPPQARTLSQARQAAERLYLGELKRRFNGNIAKMATEAGVSKMTIYNLLRRLGLSDPKDDEIGDDPDGIPDQASGEATA